MSTNLRIFPFYGRRVIQFNPAAIIDAQKSHFATGTTIRPVDRTRTLAHLKTTIESNRQKIIDALHEDLGKPPLEGYMSEIAYVLMQIEHDCRNIKKWSKKKKVSTPLVNQPGKSWYAPRPFGCTLIIGPWNYPFGLIFSPVVSSLAAGNCAILKPSEYAPATASCIEAMIAQSFNPGLLTVITGGPEETKQLIANNPDFIFFTGGGRTGKAVMEAASRTLTPVALELGGKNPCIVDAGVPVKETAKRIAWGKFLNAGQTCVSPDFLCAHESVFDSLQKTLIETIKDFYGDDPRTSPDFGRIINPRHAHRLADLLKDTKPSFGGAADPDNRFIAPAIVPFDNWDIPLMDEEVFGPILPITSYSGLDTLLARLRALPAPLALYCFTSDSAVKKNVLQESRSGTVCFNGTAHAIVSSELPFGGIGDSGIGRYHGKAGFDTFSYIRSVMDKHHGLGFSQMYPPYTKSVDFISKIRKFLL
ncbi:MAG: aldehyde dehydrogenase family protein [Chitinivibrionales bacterium]|nr:aldehyde dehydrogenase family protein [Chitinivibrionales bacterium]